MNFPWFCVRISAHAFCHRSPLHRNHSMYGHGKFGITFCFFLNWFKCVCARVESNFGPSPSYHPPNGIIQSYEQRILKITPPICSFHYVGHKKWKKLFFSLNFFHLKTNSTYFWFYCEKTKNSLIKSIDKSSDEKWFRNEVIRLNVRQQRRVWAVVRIFPWKIIRFNEIIRYFKCFKMMQLNGNC